MSKAKLSKQEIIESISSFATSGAHHIRSLIRAIDDRLRNTAENKEGNYPEQVIQDAYITWYLFELLEKELPDSIFQNIDSLVYDLKK